MLGDNGEHDRNLDSLLDGADGFVLDEGVAHDAEGALMLGIGRDAGRAAAVRHPAADTREHRHLRGLDDRLGDGGLRREGVDRDDRIGVDVLDNRHVGGEHQRLDASTEHADPAALADAPGHLQRVFSQFPLINRYKLLQSVLLRSTL